jgi:hypothetical protein
MKPITKNHIITIQTIISQKGLRDEKEMIVTSASSGRTCHVSELYDDESVRLINFLNSQVVSPRPFGVRNDGAVNNNDEGQKMRKHIVAMAHELGWIKKEMKVMREGGMKEVNNYDDLNNWIIKYGYLHKPMWQYKYQELPKLVTQMKTVYESKIAHK